MHASHDLRALAPSAALLTLSLALVAACGRGAPQAGGAGAAVEESAAPAAAVAADTGAAGAAPGAGDTVVTLEPTRGDEVPAAILGRGPAPQGAPLAYFDGDPAARGYIALPKTPGRHPAVILIHEWNGLDDRIRQTADAMAAEGYVALAVDLFSGKLGTNPDENRALIAAAMADQQKVVANLDAAARYLRGRPDVTGKIATMGWCFGGGVALSYGIGGERHEGTAIFYGQLVTDPERLRPMSHPVYGTFAGLDDGPSPAQVEQFVGALRSAGIENDVHVYDEVDHGFWLYVERDPAKATEPAKDAWRRLKAWLGRTIG
jgi:carboxymethylenebutenolidase